MLSVTGTRGPDVLAAVSGCLYDDTAWVRVTAIEYVSDETDATPALEATVSAMTQDPDVTVQREAKECIEGWRFARSLSRPPQ